MTDDLEHAGEPDDLRIDIEQDHEVLYWSEKFRVAPYELRNAVQLAGPIAKDVRRYLGRRNRR
jgi:hypothetical protein